VTCASFASLEEDGSQEARTLFLELVEEIEQTPLGKLQPGEPLFWLRGQDAVFVPVVLHYAERFRDLGGSEEQYRDIVQMVGRAVTWQALNTTFVHVAD